MTRVPPTLSGGATVMGGGDCGGGGRSGGGGGMVVVVVVHPLNKSISPRPNARCLFSTERTRNRNFDRRATTRNIIALYPYFFNKVLSNFAKSEGLRLRCSPSILIVFSDFFFSNQGQSRERQGRPRVSLIHVAALMFL